MTLSPDLLRQAISPFFRQEGMPASAPGAISAWSSAYASYAQFALAGGTLPATLSPIAVPGPFFDALDQTLMVMWTAVPWFGPGLTGVTAVVPQLSPILESIGASLLTSRDPRQALTAIADALHTYTLGIMVTVVTPTGASSIAPVT